MYDILFGKTFSIYLPTRVFVLRFRRRKKKLRFGMLFQPDFRKILELCGLKKPSPKLVVRD